MLTPDTILAAARVQVPRYTSYPTAPHFHPGVDATTYRAWLAALPENAALSLYVHIPYCDTLCWFCGCHTKITRRHAPVTAYVAALKAEIASLSVVIPASARVAHLHWGGGSPTLLTPDEIRDLATALETAFPSASARAFAVEVDPRGLAAETARSLADAGLTRVSIGVQDFAPEVQQAINRIQSFEETARAAALFRDLGVRSLNIDAVYGLPRQTTAHVLATMRQIASLRPDRIALFGYAHVPWMKRHQAMIHEADLPGPLQRHEQAEAAAAALTAEGYIRIGFDHFALPDDDLAIAARAGSLIRNFQGYTVDPADALIGLGASSIGRLPQGYVQNEPAIGTYSRTVLGGGLATARGYALTEEDRIRARIIERLLCDMVFDPADLADAPPALAETLNATATAILADDTSGFVTAHGKGFRMTDDGRAFVRLTAARFDAHLTPAPQRHAAAI